MLTKRVLVLIKKESVYGQDPTPTSTDDPVIQADLEITPEIDEISRPSVLGTSQLKSIGGKRRTNLNFTTELRGSGFAGVAPTGIGAALQSCGMSETIVSATSVTYAFLMATYPSCTIWVYMDGLCFKVNGCVGNWEITGKAGEPVQIKWTMQGLYATPTDIAFPSSATFDATIPVVCKNLTATLDSYAAVMREFMLKSGHKITERGDMTGTHGIRGYQITETQPEGSLTVESTILGGKNWYTKFEADTDNALSIVLGSVAGNIVTITAAHARIKQLPYSDEDGILVSPIAFQLAASTTGNDQLSIVLS